VRTPGITGKPRLLYSTQPASKKIRSWRRKSNRCVEMEAWAKWESERGKARPCPRNSTGRVRQHFDWHSEVEECFAARCGTTGASVSDIDDSQRRHAVEGLADRPIRSVYKRNLILLFSAHPLFLKQGSQCQHVYRVSLEQSHSPATVLRAARLPDHPNQPQGNLSILIGLRRKFCDSIVGAGALSV
jgi:hypothetical protein